MPAAAAAPTGAADRDADFDAGLDAVGVRAADVRAAVADGGRLVAADLPADADDCALPAFGAVGDLAGAAVGARADGAVDPVAEAVPATRVIEAAQAAASRLRRRAGRGSGDRGIRD